MWVSALRSLSSLSRHPNRKVLWYSCFAFTCLNLESHVRHPFALPELQPTLLFVHLLTAFDSLCCRESRARCPWWNRHIAEDMGESEISARCEPFDIPWHSSIQRPQTPASIQRSRYHVQISALAFFFRELFKASYGSPLVQI